jgi:hypothetical protein
VAAEEGYFLHIMPAVMDSCAANMPDIMPVVAVVESCDAIDASAAPASDCSFTAGDPSTCLSGCIYTVPVEAVAASWTDCSFTEGDYSSCGSGCTYTAAADAVTFVEPAQTCTGVDTPYAGCTAPECTDVDTPYTGCTVPECTAVDTPYAGCTVPTHWHDGPADEGDGSIDCSGINPDLPCDAMLLIDEVRDAQSQRDIYMEIFCPFKLVRDASPKWSSEVVGSCSGSGGGR